ncbi:MAG: glycosyltransferase [Solirubrobacterales bacterium]|nr:glycosyltransferase [Solirubrobacterales bacterium]
MGAPWLLATVCTNRPASAARVAIEPAAAQAAAVEGAAALLVTSGLDDDAHAAHERLAAEVGAEAVRAVAGLSAARNAALDGRPEDAVIAYLDDDAVPAPDWLQRLSARWLEADPDVACIGGAIVPRYLEPPPAWMSERIWMAYSLMDRGPGMVELRPEEGSDAWGANVSFRARQALDAGGFDPSRGPWSNVPMFGDESDLQLRLRSAGLRVLYAGDVRVEHLIGAERMTLRSLARRQYYRGFGAALSSGLGPSRAAARAAKASGGLAIALARGDRPLAAERLARVSLNAGAAASPVSRRRLHSRGWPQPGHGADPSVPGGEEVVLVSPAGTGGWRSNEEELAASLARLRVPNRVVRSAPRRGRRLLRIWPLGAQIVARAARGAAMREVEAGCRALLMVNSTSALQLPWRRLRENGVRVAIRVDAPASALWPGAAYAIHGALERRALGRADAVLATGPRSAALLRRHSEAVVELPVPVEPGEARPPSESTGAIAYAGQPEIKGLDRICAAWASLDEREEAPALTITGVERELGLRLLDRAGVAEPPGAVWTGELPRARFLELLAGAVCFVSASRMEGYGIAQLEALSVGVPLVTAPAPGAYEAELLARELAQELVAPSPEPEALAAAVRAAMAMGPAERSDYAERARKLLAPFGRDRADLGTLRALGLLSIEPRSE